MDLILDNILGFLYIWQEFHSFLSYIDCMGIIPKRNDICLVDICHKHYSYESKIFLVLMIRRGNNFGHRWCDALIVCSILPLIVCSILPLSFFQKIWHISNEMDLIFVVLCIQPFPYDMLRIKNFSHCWSIRDLEWSIWPSKRMREKLLAILLVLIFSKMWIL